jgi:hypothetical protein
MMLKKPVIAAISGYAVAGGCELACWCDLRVVDQSAILGIYCRMRGTRHLRIFLIVAQVYLLLTVEQYDCLD